MDDFTVVWPGAARVERLLAGLTATPGVRVDGVWRPIGAPTTMGQDAELLAQIAANRADGVAILVDAAPGLLAADWAVAAVVPPGWASPGSAGAAIVGHASWRAPVPPRLPEVTPVRARAMIGPDGHHYALAPFGRAGLVLMVARDYTEPLTAAAFHATEVERLAQLVRASAVILGDRLDLVGAPPVTTAT